MREEQPGNGGEPTAAPEPREPTERGSAAPPPPEPIASAERSTDAPTGAPPPGATPLPGAPPPGAPPPGATPPPRADPPEVAESAPNGGRPAWASISRWTAGIVVLFLAAVLGGVAVIAGYVRDHVLDTETYVQTVTPLITEPSVQDALAERLSTVIVTQTDLKGLAGDLASGLVKQGAPPRVQDLVPPLISGITTFLDTTIRKLLASPQFQTIWENINRTAHAAVVSVLTGQNSNLVKSNGRTITIDLGQLLVPIKQQLVSNGLTFASRIPTVSIPYTIVTSDKLPKVRTYVRILNAVATWLPWVALAMFVGGVLTVPNRRRGIITGVLMLGVVDILLLAGLAVGRSIYLDQLPATVQSPQAAEDIYDTVLRFLNEALQSILLAVIVILAAALLAGPSRPARWIRHQIGRALSAAGEALGRTGAWAGNVGRAVTTIRRPLELILGVLGVIIFILANRPSPGAVLWLTFGIVLAIIAIEILARMAGSVRGQPA
ncbi:MAG TPA: hypothetical protein VFR11_16910 [Micromonosporaceae bacterium]|nr:hypothetical protein [Micromonosporaceae bacterium]